MPKYIVLDSNIVLLDATNILTLGDADTVIVIPSVVCDEVDSKKSGFSELAFQAREFGRILTSGYKRKSVQLEHLTYTDFSIGKRTVTIVDPHTYPDFTDSEPNIIADRKIIYTAQLWSKLEEDTVFMSNDVMCRIRCAASGLRVQDLRQVSNVPTEFIKYFTVTDEQFSNLHNKSIIDINPDHKPENYNYVFSTDPATFNKLAYIDSGTIQIIGKATEEELRRQDISPINHEQLFLSRAIQDPTMDIVVVESLAGSGKSLVALSNAIKLVKSQTPYNSIVYIRNSVDDAEQSEDIGYLSTNEAKMAVYLHPLQDSIDAIIRSKYSNSKLKGEELEAYLTDQREKLIASCRLVGMIALGTRGRTFNDAIVIIDEAQNMSKATMQKLLTRIGKNCKVIVTGSLKQIDNAYINKYSSGLSTLLDACTSSHEDINICAVPLTKVVRGKVTAFAERIFTQSKGN
jgi:PhoH-like ATPase